MTRTAWLAVLAGLGVLTLMLPMAGRGQDGERAALRLSGPAAAVRDPVQGEMVPVPSSPAVLTLAEPGTPAGTMVFEQAGEPPPCPVKTVGEGKRRFTLEASWAEGLRLSAADDSFHVHVGGNAQWDAAALIGPTSVFAIPGGETNGVENAAVTQIRRARFRMDGDIWTRFGYMVEFDLANADNYNSGLQAPSLSNINAAPAPCNVWMEIRDLPVLGDLRIGHQVKPIGMTNNTYQAWLPFLERSYIMDAFYGPFDKGFNNGVAAFDWTESERLTWRYGVYMPTTDVFGIALNKVDAGARVTGLPVYEQDGARLVHVGLGTLFGQLTENQSQLRARAVIRNGPGYAVPVLVETPSIPAVGQAILAPEFAMVWGPWTVQAEWTGEFVTGATPTPGPEQTLFYQGGYAEVLYFLTGEHTDYLKREGVFGRPVPHQNFTWSRKDPLGGCGAWQLGVRFGYLNLNDKSVQGGQVWDWTAGVNWYLNPNMRLQLNGMIARREAPQQVIEGWISGVGFRANWDL